MALNSLKAEVSARQGSVRDACFVLPNCDSVLGTFQGHRRTTRLFKVNQRCSLETGPSASDSTPTIDHPFTRLLCYPTFLSIRYTRGNLQGQLIDKPAHLWNVGGNWGTQGEHTNSTQKAHIVGIEPGSIDHLQQLYHSAKLQCKDLLADSILDEQNQTRVSGAGRQLLH